MSSLARVVVHASQFPQSVRRDLLVSLRSRRVNHKFHYDSVKQTGKWLALHQALSPSRKDADCAGIYDRAFVAAARRVRDRRVLLIGLGCGGGRKDTRLLRLLQQEDREVFYSPCDVSAAMVLEARQTALAVVPDRNCFPFVCDLATADGLPGAFRELSPPLTARLFSFLGMIPNFEPETILPRIAQLLRRRDFLLLSANLAPGADYARGVAAVLPQYDNTLTREWLMTFLLDLGIERRDGDLRFRIETRRGLKRVVAGFRFEQSRRLQVDGRHFEFTRGQVIRLFFSYRYTPGLVRSVLRRFGLAVTGEWIAASGEEGVFLCRRGQAAAGQQARLSS